MDAVLTPFRVSGWYKLLDQKNGTYGNDEVPVPSEACARIAKAAAARINGDEEPGDHGHSHEHGHSHGGDAFGGASAAPSSLSARPSMISRAGINQSVDASNIPASLPQYKMRKVIGRGSHSKVLLAEAPAIPDTFFAIRALKCESVCSLHAFGVRRVTACRRRLLDAPSPSTSRCWRWVRCRRFCRRRTTRL